MSSFQCNSFQAASFQTNCPTSGGGGGHSKGRRRISIPVIDNRMHDDEIALLLLEAEDGY
jgi:hypothetical protein